MSYISKDGHWYNTEAEKNAADRGWEQNQLLREQNELLKETEARLRREESVAETKRLWEAVEHKMRNVYAKLDRDVENIYPIFQEAGAKNPEAYVNKLEELYPCKLTKPPEPRKFPTLELNELTTYNVESLQSNLKDISALQKTIQEMETEEDPLIDSDHSGELSDCLRNISKAESSLLDRLSSIRAQIDAKRVLWIIPALVASIAILICSIDILGDVFFAVPILIIMNSVLLLLYKKTTRRLRDSDYVDEAETQKISLLIRDYNIVVIESEELYRRKGEADTQLQKNRIQVYEQRRISNFNPPLEYALEKLTEAYGRAFSSLQKIEKDYGVNLHLSSAPDFRLQEYSYPSEYEKYKKQLSLQKADNDGTSIFLGL